MKKIYTMSGIFAFVIYVSTVIIGGLLRSDYSSLSNTISELIVNGAPNKTLLDTMFNIYNILLLVFGFGLFSYYNRTRKNNSKLKASFIIISIMGILGLLMYIFPQDAVRTQITREGIIHIVLAGFSSLLTIIAMVLAGLGFEKEDKLQNIGKYSIVSSLVVFITGGIAAISVANNSTYGGLFERFTIGTFILWILVISIKLYLCNEKGTDA